jgi:hypothetical protein
MLDYGKPPKALGRFDFDLPEVMYYLYLPVRMAGRMSALRLPPNLERVRQLIHHAQNFADRDYKYVYISARKGWATPDNPLNRPGWHCDGFGTDDLNFVWWVGASTRFAIQHFDNISDDHVESLRQFEEQVDERSVFSGMVQTLYKLDPAVVHATPIILPPGGMRQYVKISFSDHRYNLADNSHNYLFDYEWSLSPREIVRNDTHTAQKDFVAKVIPGNPAADRQDRIDAEIAACENCGSYGFPKRSDCDSCTAVVDILIARELEGHRRSARGL